ncbi:hypothetical protein Misp03_11400 [Microbispora sp. NBRC 16548]|nr:hypothetical protein Misp03_11400 [Microbispora sp. NBRC 16548]
MTGSHRCGITRGCDADVPGEVPVQVRLVTAADQALENLFAKSRAHRAASAPWSPVTGDPGIRLRRSTCSA